MTIKVVPPHVQIPSVMHAYQPDEPASIEEPSAPIEEVTPQVQSDSERKTIGNMYEEEFIEVMIKALIQADKVKASLNESEEPEVEKSPVGKVLRTIGDVAHGIIDIAEGGVRGVVDVCTIGHARRK